MANAMYGKGREAFGNGNIDWLAGNIIIVLVDSGLYTKSIDLDEFLDDIPAGARVDTSGNLASKTNALGVLDAADVNFAAVSGNTVEEIVVLLSTGTESTSYLIANFDTVTGLPFTPNGGPADVTWDNGTNRILKL